MAHPCGIDEKNFPDEVFQQDGSDVIWFFNDIYFNLHPKLKGRQVFTLHGVSFKKWADQNKPRVAIINQYIDLVFLTGWTHEWDYLRYGIKKNKLRRIGYTLLFEIPERPVRPGAVLFYCELSPKKDDLEVLIHALENLGDDVHGYLTTHPENEEKTLKRLIEICEKKDNLTFIKTPEALLEAFAYCHCCAGGLSSVAAPFFFRGKPVIFIMDQGRIPWLNRWRRASQTNAPLLFHNVLAESAVLKRGMRLDTELIKKAKSSRSAKSIFYNSNFDKQQTIAQVREAIQEIERNEQRASL